MTPDAGKDAGTISAGSAPYLLRHHQGARLGRDTPISSINCHRASHNVLTFAKISIAQPLRKAPEANAPSRGTHITKSR